jgi:DNA primase
MTDQKDEIRNTLVDPERVLDSLGLLDNAKRSSTGYYICCPWHAENEPSCSVRRHPGDGTLSVKCFACGGGGDVFALVGQVHQVDNFPRVLEIAADMAGIQLDNKKPRRPTPRPVFKPRPPVYPDASEINDMYYGAMDPRQDSDAVKWMDTKNISKSRAGAYCGVIPHGYDLPSWAKFATADDQPEYNWIKSGHRMVFPMYDSDGTIRTLRARCLHPGKLKNVNPLGYNCGGLAFACETGHALLRNDYAGKLTAVVFVEGESDFLNAISRRIDSGIAIFGIYSGGWSVEHCKKIPDGTRLVFLTDRDTAGNKYKQDIARMFMQARSDTK